MTKGVLMKKLHAFLLVCSFSLSGLSLAQHDMSGMHMDMNMSSNDMLSGLEGQDLEVSFLSMMIAHHEGAVEMAGWILERTQNADIQAAAGAIIAAQEPEIQQMTQWLQDWYGQGADDHSAMMMQNEMDSMMSVMEADANPDATFLEQMSMHHNSAIDMAQAALLKATHSELRELAKNMIVVQTQEIAQYQTWLESLDATAQQSTQQHAGHGGTSSPDSPYTDQLESSVRGLSQEEVDSLLAGEGMGYARSAELNGYPGPRHTLDLAKELNLTIEQQAKIQPIFEEMKREAVALGQEIVAAEATLSKSFADGTLTSESLQTQLGDLATLYAQLRHVHLQAHLEVTPLLTQEQVAQYQVLRGYAQN
jgi:uncharacterized protein (DUF305 family)